MAARKAQTPSPEATELLAAGAAPSEVDSAELLRQLQALQAKVDAMQRDRGTPEDPVEAALQNLRTHLTARRQMHRRKEDLDELKAALDEAAGAGELDSDETAFILEIAGEVSGTVEGHEYLRQLARDLHRAVRAREETAEEEDDETVDFAPEDEPA